MPPVGFEPTISAGERPQTYALDRAATGTGASLHFKTLKSHTKTLKIRPYIFRSTLKPSSESPWPYFVRLLNCNVDLHLL